jgi:hypothetical protein
MSATLSDDAMIDLLSTEEDRLSRAAVDEILRRPHLAPRLAALIDEEELWTIHDASSWAPVHATFLLAAMKPPGGLDAVLRALERAAAQEETFLMDVADSLLAAFGPRSVPALIAAFERASSYPRIWINDALAHLATAHPETRDAVRAHLKRAALEADAKEVSACAAENLLVFATDADRDTLAVLADRRLLEAEDVEDALAGTADLSLPPPLDFLRFYDAEAIAERNEDAADESLEDVLPSNPSLEVLSRIDEPPGAPAPIINAERKVGRNDPCTCGSGKKFKKCCGT